MWKVKAKMVAVMGGPLREVTPKLGEWLQWVLRTSELSVQKNAVLETGRILCRTLKPSKQD